MKKKRHYIRRLVLFVFLFLILVTSLLFSKIDNSSFPIRILARRIRSYLLVRLPRSKKLYADNLSKQIITDFVTRYPSERLIIIDKTIRKLYLYENNRLVDGFPVHLALGFDPMNSNKRRGDGRTPEGEYFIYNKHASASYKYFLEISYPNHLDVERGLRDGLITPAEGKRILRGLETLDGGIRGTTLGDAVGIHTRGLNDSRPATLRNWTLGCIALEKDDMHRVFQDARIGHKVLVIGRSYKKRYRS